MLEPIQSLITQARALRHADPTGGISLAADAVSQARPLLAADASVEHVELLARALWVKGHCERLSSALADAVADCSEAVALFSSIGNQQAESLARSQWGVALLQLGDLTGGLAQLERAMELSKAVGDEEHVSDCLVDIGIVNNLLGNDARAIELYQQAMVYFERSGDHYHHATCLSNAAVAHTSWGRRERQSGNELSALEHFRQARTLASQAIVVAERSEDLDFLALRYVTLAEAEREAGDLPACINTLETQLPLTEKLGSKRTQALCLKSIAAALIDRAQDGDEARALNCLQAADTLCEEHSLAEIHPPILHEFAKLHEKFNRPADALAAYKRFHDIEIRVHTQTAERDAKTLESRLRAEHMQKELDLAKLREAELTALNSRLHDQKLALERLAHIDSLTGLPNRRAWLAGLEQAWANGNNDVYVFLLDLDHFKAVNDTHGHRAGDDVLVATAKLVRRVFGACGAVGRFGGEEFVAWIRAVNHSSAARCAERLVEALRSHPWRQLAPALEVTGSLGWCAGSLHETPFDALATADQNMYQAKRAGRNRIVGSPRILSPTDTVEC